MNYVLKSFLSILFILLGVAFFTLLERKVLSYVSFRLGPSKVLMGGFFQPFSDAIKLFMKEDLKLKDLNIFSFFFFPIFFILLSLFFWGLVPLWGVLYFSKFSLVAFICLIGVGVYFLLFSGWASNSSFSLLGGCRSSAQSISYEVVMVFCLLFLVYFWYFLSFLEFKNFSLLLNLFLGLLILSFSWLLSCLAESNRSPFDFSEGESELVSGFNTEYSGGLFSLIFIGEYAFILLLSFFSSFLLFDLLLVFFYFCLVAFFYLWVRSTYARLRYDFLMSTCWKGLVFLLMSCYFFYFVVF